MKASYVYAIVVALYLALGIYSGLHHEMWRDELQAWSLAASSNSLGELYANTRYEGHPLLWFLVLFALTSVTKQVVAMQVIHLLIAAAAATILLVYAPFPRWQRILLIFGYFMLYEYATICRNYGIAVLLLLIYCVLMSRPRVNYLLAFGVLTLLAQTNVFYAIAAVALALFTLIQYGYSAGGKVAGLLRRPDLVAGGVLFGLGLGVAAFTMMPPPDTGYATGWNFAFDPGLFALQVDHIWESYFPIPKLTKDFWTNNVMDGLGLSAAVSHYAKLLLSVGILLYVLLLFARKPTIAFLAGFGTLAILTFCYVKYSGYLYHHGSFYFLFIAAYWLSYYVTPIRVRPVLVNRVSVWCNRYSGVFLLTILLAGVAAASISIYKEVRYPFSESKAVAQFIDKSSYRDYPIAGKLDYTLTPVASYLSKKIYYPQADRWGSFVIWNARRDSISTEQFIREGQQLSQGLKRDVLLIFNQKPGVGASRLIPLRSFTNGIITDEQYYLYILKYVPDTLPLREQPPQLRVSLPHGVR